MRRDRDVVDFHLRVPTRLHDELQAIADREDVPLAIVIRRFFRLGLVVDAIAHSPTSNIIIHDSEKGDRILTMAGEDVGMEEGAGA